MCGILLTIALACGPDLKEGVYDWQFHKDDCESWQVVVERQHRGVWQSSCVIKHHRYDLATNDYVWEERMFKTSTFVRNDAFSVVEYAVDRWHGNNRKTTVLWVWRPDLQAYWHDGRPHHDEIMRKK